jgi:bacterioferritin-associated ferredoxin
VVICLCRGVNDRVIRGAIDGGARTLREVGHRTGAATDCGSCACDVAKLLGERGERCKATGPSGGSTSGRT